MVRVYDKRFKFGQNLTFSNQSLMNVADRMSKFSKNNKSEGDEYKTADKSKVKPRSYSCKPGKYTIQNETNQYHRKNH